MWQQIPKVCLSQVRKFLALSPLLGAQIAKADQAKNLEHFETHIRPLLSKYCYECHSTSAKKLKANLYLDSRSGWQAGGDSGPPIIPGKPNDSLLIDAVTHTGDLEMPPKNRLSDSQINHLKQWITNGAPDPREGEVENSFSKIDLKQGRQFWSFQPVKHQPIPKVKNTSWPTNTIDHFILAQLESKQITPAPDATKTTLLRRIYFDLIGLPPSPAETKSFLADSSPQAFEKVVDDLLARPEFGERWGRHWLDVTRFAESSGGGRSLVFHDAWRFRDYVIKSFNQDKPYDQLIREHLSGDLLPHQSDEQKNNQLIGSGYLVLGALNYELQDHELLKMEFVDEQIDAVGRTFLGMTLGCARCHDHQFDPIPTSDYYALAGIFQSTESMGKGSAATGVTSFATHQLATSNSAEIEKIQSAQADLATQITALKSQLGKKSNKGSLDPDTLPGIVIDSPEAKLTGKWLPSTHSSLWVGKNYLHDDNKLKGKKSAEFATTLPETRDYQVLLSYSSGPSRAKNVPVTIRHAEGETTVTVDQSKPGTYLNCFTDLGTFPFSKDHPASVTISTEGTTTHVIADAVSFVTPGEITAPKINHKKLAADLKKLEAQKKSLAAQLKKLQPVTMAVSESETIADGHIHIRGQVRNKGPKVPRGFITVATSQNITIPADRSGRLELAEWITDPTHPLTARVMTNRIWKTLMGQGIVRTPDNFGVTGELPSHPELLDHLAFRFTENNWSIKTLIREIALSRTYQLSSRATHQEDPENRLFGRAHRKRLEAEAIRDTVLLTSSQLDPTRGGRTIRTSGQYDLNYKFDTKRRSVYVPWFRNSILPIFEIFDVANPNLVVGKRTTTNLPTQSLFLMNSAFIRKHATLTAKNLLSQKATIPDAYQLILSRPPSQSELTTTQSFLKNFPPDQTEEAWTQLTQTLFASLDFRFLD